MSDVLDLTIQKGIPYYKSFQYAVVENDMETPIPINNANLTLKVRHTPGNPNILFEANTSNYLVIIDGSNGEIGLQIPKEIIDTFSFKKAVYDIIIQLPNKDPIKLIGGKFTVEPLVSRG